MSAQATIGAGAKPASGRRGSPLAIIAVILASWIAARGVLWESPFVLPEFDLPLPVLIAENQETNDATAEGPIAPAAVPAFTEGGKFYLTALAGAPLQTPADLSSAASRAAAHQRLMSRAFAVDWHSAGASRPVSNPSASNRERIEGVETAAPPFATPPRDLPQTTTPEARRPDRWSLDAFAFFREGSGAVSTSQGRAPVYGASQIAANLRYRVAPKSGFDPRVFVRAYRALVDGGETEGAAGVSVRPVPPVPLRLTAEMRVSNNPVGTDYRPAAYVVSELPAQKLPLGLSLETYAAAGYVGGEAETYFADGQAVITREVITLKGPGESPIRLSIGGGGWGGAQEGTERVGVGPTVRFDLSVGDVPARISVDWRERVAGDADPDSGVAATVSTRF